MTSHLCDAHVSRVQKDLKGHLNTCAKEVLQALEPMKDATLVMSEESLPTLSEIALLHAKLVTSTEGGLDDTQTVKDIRAASAQDLGKRNAT